MNPSYYQNQINKIEKDIADLHKKIADESKKENDKIRQIDSVNKSINKSTSISTLQSKQKQIVNYQTEILNCKKKVADYQNKISTKTIELGKKKQELRKAENNELKKQNQKQTDFQKNLQRTIEEQKAHLNDLINQNYSSKTITIGNNEQQKQYDFFISHASEDKEDIVRNLAEALRESGFQVWYDEFELKIGDSLRKKIDLGLINSKFGIVIISPSFVRKNWTEYELNGMVAREMNGHKVILPIWHKITKDEVLKFSPTLADKMALNTSIHTIDDIVASLREL
ncbi:MULTISPECIES: toll/interleukin-1 receptor domain-containing protein [Chryseobacterium]|uniref:Toll/interleukin-1 receptor domain-containing protein n=1 Tax=Candidatus Chryseobacterium massiliense TaxID=204089 RepID=A0A3D9BC99_9FLAO|nr:MULTISPECIES: toll/interleukin-1 receptor domain-containing protein [Chryseobacterium]REC51201.1 toll/interleukin-1 receptor domain-containing protein [Candidatus Chryseobacterium massiliae]